MTDGVLNNVRIGIGASLPRTERGWFTVILNSKLTILVAEDSEDDADLLKVALQRAGLPNPVHICRDGHDVLAYLNGEGEYADRSKFPFPRMLIIDLKMPGLTGFEVLAWIGEHPDCAVIPTVVLSASNQPEDVLKAYQLGANAYLMKPQTVDALQNLVTRLERFWTCCELPQINECR